MQRRKRVWLAGGIGLIVCGVIGVLHDSFLGLPLAGLVVGLLADVVWAAAVLVFAVGVSRESSVVARRPLGLVALGVVALWPLIASIVGAAIQPAAAPGDGLMVWGYASIVVPLLAGILAAVQIARSGTVPAPWNWAPLAALGVQVIAGVLPQLLFSAVGPAGAQQFAGLSAGLGMLGFLVITFGLGIAAIAMATRLRADPVPILRSDSLS